MLHSGNQFRGNFQFLGIFLYVFRCNVYLIERKYIDARVDKQKFTARFKDWTKAHR